jgi:hypothetical protein
MITSDTSIEAALEPMQLAQSIRQGRRLPICVQALRLDWPSSSRCIPEGPLQVASGLGVVRRTFPTGGLTCCNRQSSESDG